MQKFCPGQAIQFGLEPPPPELVDPGDWLCPFTESENTPSNPHFYSQRSHPWSIKARWYKESKQCSVQEH